MTKKVLLLVAALAAPAAAHAASGAGHRQQAASPAPPQIACTKYGCIPVQPGCHPAPGKTWDGLPSGYDVMVCPGGTLRALVTGAGILALAWLETAVTFAFCPRNGLFWHKNLRK